VRDHGFVSILDDIKSIKARKGKFGSLEQDIDRLKYSVSGIFDNEEVDHLAEDCPERFAFLDFKCYYEDGYDELTYALSGGYWGGGYIAIWRPPSREMVLKAITIEHDFWDFSGDDPQFRDDPLDGFVALIGCRSQVDFSTNKLIPKDVYVYDIWYAIFDDDVTPLCWDAKECDQFKDKMRRAILYRSHEDGRLQKGPGGEIFWVEQVGINEILRRLKDPDLLHGAINRGVCIRDFVAKLEASFAKAEARRLAAPAEALARAKAQATKLLVDQFNCLLAYLSCAPFNSDLSHRLCALGIDLCDPFVRAVPKACLSKYLKETIYSLDLASMTAEPRAAESYATKYPIQQFVDLRSLKGFGFSERRRPSKMSTSGTATDLRTTFSFNSA
jgi:hypothetical protein